MFPIRVAAFNTYRNLSMALPIFKPVVQTAKVGVLTPEILPAVPVGMSFLYEAASDKSSGHPTGLLSTLLAAGESYLNQHIITKAHDLFIYLPLATGAYELGRAKSGREKMFEILRTSLLFSAGYFGMTNIGFGICNALQLSEAEQMLNALNSIPQESLKKIPLSQRSLLENLTRAATRQKRVLDFYRTNPKKPLPESALTKALTKLSDAQKQLLAIVPEIQTRVLPQLSESAQQNIQHLFSLTRSYQAPYVKVLRKLNPIFGYFIATSLMAAPVISILRNVILPEGESSERLGKLITPLWAEDALNLVGSFNPLSWRARSNTETLSLGQPF